MSFHVMPEPQIEVWATPNYLVWIIHSEIICVPGQLLRSADWIILLFQLFNSTSNWELALECEGCEVIFCCSQLLSRASGDVSEEYEGCREEPKVGGQKWGRVWEPRMRALEWHPGESKAADCRPGELARNGFQGAFSLTWARGRARVKGHASLRNSLN